MNILSRFLAPAMLALCALPALAGDVRVGFVDIERILRESAPAVKAAQKIEKEFAPRDEAIKRLGAQVRELQDFLEKKGAGLSNAERRNKERELSNLSAELQREQREFREDLNQRKNEEYSVLLERANKIIQAIAISEHYDLVLQEAVYRNPQIDITDKVLKALSSDK
ncbi:MAG TPA: OmpH family outer membrane protein [Gallionellaceae bacterium]